MDYGDVMHTYDGERHCWKYDMGGYAWQNTELVPTLWLWYYFMRTGREDVFTMAEAMSRHTSEVDIYHFGKFKGLGSRHNVVHWGDACKEPRISMAGHHRFLYYMLGGDDRLKDIFEDVRDADYSTLEIDPLRFFYNKEDMKMPTHARTGPDWASYCSNWFTWSEITGDFTYMDKIKTGLSDIKKSPMRMISGSNYEYDPRTGHLGYIGESAAGGSHLAICMGEPQFWFELADCMEDEELKCMLVEYGRFYYLPPEEKERESGGLISSNGWSFPYMAAALAAYSARYGDNEALAGKVWDTLITELKKEDGRGGFNISTVRDYYNAPEIQEIKGVSTNFTSQWCLNVITSLELIGNKLANSEK